MKNPAAKICPDFSVALWLSLISSANRKNFLEPLSSEKLWTSFHDYCLKAAHFLENTAVAFLHHVLCFSSHFAEEGAQMESTIYLHEAVLSFSCIGCGQQNAENERKGKQNYWDLWGTTSNERRSNFFHFESDVCFSAPCSKCILESF